MASPDMNLAPSPTPIYYQMEDKHAIKLWSVPVLVILGIVALFVLHVLGPLRRMSSHKLLHAVVLGTYTLSYMLVAFTLGLMQSPTYYFVNTWAVWAVCLLLLLGSTDSLIVCRLNDIDEWKSLYVKHLIKGGVVVYIVVRFGRWGSGGFYALLWGMIVVIILKSYIRITSMRMASKSQLLCKFVKPIADYMHHEHRHLAHPSEQSHNLVTMEGYRYIVVGEGRQKFSVSRPTYVLTVICNEEVDLKITTVEQIWQCKGSMLCSNSERSLRLKDLCLSMALSKMLNRRFAGFELPEAGLEKTHDFVFSGLLTGDMSYERAFRVIEVELAFVYDMYYTGYPYVYRKGRFFALYLPIIMVILCLWLTYKLNRYLKDNHEDLILRTTLFLMVVVTFLEVLQLYLHMTSGWFKVALIRSYVTRPILQREGSFFEIIIGLLLRLKTLRPWEQNLGQYSLLQKFDSTRGISICLHYATLCLVDKAKKGRKRGKLVKLSKQVKKAVANSLVESNGHLTNGVRSLRNHGVHEKFSWACDTSNTLATHTILIWHIATTLCKHQLDAQAKDNQLLTISEEDRSMIDVTSSVASDLSQYCAYLIAFAPDLLPDHSSASAVILDESIKEARQLLKGANTMERKYDKLMSMSTTRDVDDAPFVVLGARLARQLTENIQNPKLRWEVLSDFWAEMVLYVAPSDNTRAHLETLARGGEFITHLWALLTHAGILKQTTAWPVSDV